MSAMEIDVPSRPIQVVPSETAYKPVETSTPLYRFTQISPDSQPSASLTATCQAVFRIPATRIINTKKSRLRFTLTKLAEGADNFTWMHQDRLPIQGVNLMTETSVNLVDLNPFPAFQKCVYPQVLTKEKYKSLTHGISDATPVAMPTDVTACVPQGHLVRWNQTHTKNFVENALDAVDVQLAANSYDTPLFLSQCESKNAAPVYLYDIPLGDLVPHSILNQPQDLYWGQGLILTITFSPTVELGFYSTADNLFTGAATFAAAHTLTNVYLHVACQDQPAIAQAIRDEVMTKGISIPVQYPMIVQDSWATGLANYSRILTLTQSRGGSLLRVYFGVSSQVTSGFNAYNFNQLATVGIPIAADMGTRWLTYRSFQNQRPNSDYALTPFDVWQLQRGALKDTVAADPMQWQQFGGIVVEDFSGLPGTGLLDQTPLGGMSLALGVNWMVDLTASTTATINQAKNVYWVFVFSRMLRIAAGSVTLNSI